MAPSSSSVQDLPLPPEPLPPPAAPLLPPAAWPPPLPLGALGLARLPRRRDGATVDWAYGLRCAWAVGEDGAQAALATLNPNLQPYPHPQAYPYPKPYPYPYPYP